MRATVVVVLSFIVPLCSARCLEGDCENGIGKRKNKDGVFEGNFVAGRMSGQGTWKGNRKGYSGQWKNNMADGYGTFTWGKGPLGAGRGECTGQWKHDKKHGKAKCTWPTGATYEGEFDMDQRHGWGTLDWLGQHYEGAWVHDVKQGKCKLFRWKSGATYEGDWKGNGPDGQGTYHWPDGSFYTGAWQNSKMHGHGSFHTADGEVQHQLFQHGHGRELHVNPRGHTWGQLWGGVQHPLFFGLLVLGALLAAAYFFCRRRKTHLAAQGRYAELGSPIGAEFQKMSVQVGADSHAQV